LIILPVQADSISQLVSTAVITENSVLSSFTSAWHLFDQCFLRRRSFVSFTEEQRRFSYHPPLAIKCLLYIGINGMESNTLSPCVWYHSIDFIPAITMSPSPYIFSHKPPLVHTHTKHSHFTMSALHLITAIGDGQPRQVQICQQG
jgi:hypothetical protein